MRNLNYRTMRRLVFALLMLLTLSLSAQDNVMKFMGIPIDGPKSEMISKLERKGFAPEQVEIDLEKAEDDYISAGGVISEGRVRERDGEYFMHGYFDGKRSNVIISSYNNKVYQIMVVIEDPYNELNGKVQYNLYVEQLNKKYTNPIDYDFTIDLDKDLSVPFENNIRAYFTAAYDVNDRPHGLVTIELSHPRFKEFFIAIRYYNADNMPNGDDL